MRRIIDEAALSTFLSDRAAAVQAALEDDPIQGIESAKYEVTGVRCNEEVTMFCRVWGVSSVEVDTSWVIVAAHPYRRVVRSSERVATRDHPRNVFRCVLSVALRAGGAGAARGGAACI